MDTVTPNSKLKIAKRPGELRDDNELTKNPNSFELLNNHQHV